MKTGLLLTLSHAAALALGWSVFHDDPEAPVATPDSSGPKLAARSKLAADPALLAEMYERWDLAAEIALQQKMALVREASASSDPRTMIAESKRRVAEKQQRKKTAIREQSQAVVLPDDPAAELSRLLALTKSQNHGGWVHPDHRTAESVTSEKQFIETFAFLVAWLTAEPSDALVFLNSEAAKGPNDLSWALEIWIDKIGAREANEYLTATPEWREKLAGHLMSSAVRSDPSHLDELMESLEPMVGREALINATVSRLQEEDRDATTAWIIDSLEGKEAGLATIKLAIEIPDMSRARKFLKQIEPQLDPQAVKYVQGWGNYGEIMRGIGPDSSLEDRVAAALAGGVIGKTDDEKHTNARRGIIYQDLSTGLHEAGLDVRLELGCIGAADLWNHAVHAFPSYEQEARPILLEAVFMASAPEDPEGAIKLLQEGGASSQLPKLAVSALDNWFNRDLEKAVGLLRHLPEGMLREHLAEFDHGVDRVVSSQADLHGSLWIDWVEAQPPGLAKDLLLRHSAAHASDASDASDAGDEGLAASLTGQIRDQDVKNLPKP